METEAYAEKGDLPSPRPSGHAMCTVFDCAKGLPLDYRFFAAFGFWQAGQTPESWREWLIPA